ncbi:MAG: plastocyanin/azurin family copper-binding protein, partial [Verrucomicrobia bacterium]|nr:plastocyanin/azurin family copper-binding protein [Verrucomicrobiota bacterium]
MKSMTITAEIHHVQKMQPTSRRGAFRSLCRVAGVLSYLAIVTSTPGDILLLDSFGGLNTSNRLDAAGNPVVIDSSRPELAGIRAETASPAAVWMAPSGRQVPTWSFSFSSFDPYEPVSPLETPSSNGSVTFPGVVNLLADALLPFSPPAGPYRLSLDAVSGSAGIAIGFSSSQTVLTNNFESFGELWLSLGGGPQGTVVPWTLHTHGTNGASVSGTTTLGGYNPLVLSYDPVAHTVHGTVNGVDTPGISYAAVGINAVGFEGSGTVDGFNVQTPATVDVAIAGFAFTPKVLTVNVGDTVRWTQGDPVPHTTTSGTGCTPNGLWDSGSLTNIGQQFSHTFTQGGTYPYFCRPHCLGGMVGAVIVQSGTSNTPPTVAITRPANGATVSGAANVSIEATAQDLEDTIVSVEFFDGATSLGIVTSPAYAAATTFTNSSALSPGSHSLAAVATDSRGASTRSAAISITVAPVAPAKLVEVAVSGLTFAPNIVRVNAGDVVRWTNGSTFHHTTTSGTSCTTTGLWDADLPAGSSFAAQFNTGGTFPYFCKPHCTRGMVGAVIVDSAATNTPPTVAITSPLSGDTISGAASVTIDATAQDAEDTIVSVEFFDGATSLGIATSPAYAAATTFTNSSALSPGSHSLAAVATDSRGASTRSAAISITVAPVAPAKLVEVAVSGLTFAPNIVRVNAGDVVRWTNGSTFHHTTTSGTSCTTNGLWDADLPAGSSFAAQFNTGGTFPYFCKPHCTRGMVGAVIVDSAATNTPPTVAITSPANGATVSGAANVSIEATAQDLENTIVS